MNQVETAIKTVEEELTKFEENNERNMWIDETHKNVILNEKYAEQDCKLFNYENEW